MQLITEIRYAALELFAERGFDAVTIDDIADAAGISKSTFFRCMTSKESLLVDPLLEGISGIVGAFGARPDTEDITTALTRAVVDCMSASDAADTRLWRAAIASAPHLIGRIALVSPGDRARLVAAVATRMGVDAGTDSRPGLLVTITLAASEHIFQNWVVDTDADRRPTLTEQVEGALRIVLTAQWNSPQR